ncbi:MAG: hypothetical protein WEB37_04070 [Bacteroidota bacterium]
MSLYHEAKGSPILKGVIVVLFGILLYVLYEPYQIRNAEESFKRESRARMLNLRQGQLLHIGTHSRYATHLDSLVEFIRSRPDSVLASYFQPLTLSGFVPDSLLHTPKTWRPYQLITVDTTVIKKYLVDDPDGYGSIGSLTDDQRVNKPSWEQ